MVEAFRKRKLRFAPSPTGHLHLGHVVSMAFVFGVGDWLEGDVILRIEDHDKERSREAYVASIISDMEWLGFIPSNWNEVMTAGREASYRQSFRPKRYLNALESLNKKRHTYYCRCSRQEIALRTKEIGSDELLYDGACRDQGCSSGAIRMIIPDRTVAFKDMWHGTCKQRPSCQCGDLLLVDRHGHFTYNYSVVVDDIHDGINTIVRGDDLLNCTARQIMLHEALGNNKAVDFMHHPLVFDETGQKLSKRFLSTSLAPLREQGLKPEHVITLALREAKLLADNELITRSALSAWVQALMENKRGVK